MNITKYGSTISSTEKLIIHSTQWTKDLTHVLILTVLCTVGTMLHSSGLYLLLKVKIPRRGNMVAFTNKTLLVLLSCSEMSTGLFSAGSYITILLRLPKESAYLLGFLSWISGAFNLAVIYVFDNIQSSCKYCVSDLVQADNDEAAVCCTGCVGVCCGGYCQYLLQHGLLRRITSNIDINFHCMSTSCYPSLYFLSYLLCRHIHSHIGEHH